MERFVLKVSPLGLYAVNNGSEEMRRALVVDNPKERAASPMLALHERMRRGLGFDRGPLQIEPACLFRRLSCGTHRWGQFKCV